MKTTFILTLSLRGPLSYKNQSIDLLRKSITGFYMMRTSVMKKLRTFQNYET